jgi:acyl-CoA synthetase (AMP-forming)/AMP-acid ligase II
MSDVFDGNSCSTLVELLRRRAAECPERAGYLFLIDGEVEAPALTYGALDRSARAIGAALQNGGSAGERAILVFAPGLEFVDALFGCLYGGVIPVPTPAPAKPLSRSLSRLSSIIKDARPSTVLTTSSLLPLLEDLRGQLPELSALRLLTVDRISQDAAAQWNDPGQTADALALLQYTSGSTSAPKGVMVTHRNMLHNAAFYRSGWQHTPSSVTVTWMPTFHDLGLMDGIIQPLFTGYLSILMSPAAFLQRPMRWLEAISRYGATFSSAPNFAFELCVRKSSPQARAELDLRRWTAVLNAAEPVHKETIDRFASAFEPAGFQVGSFCPGYGLAEATLKVTATPKGTPAAFCTAVAAELEQGRIVEAKDEAGRRAARTIAGCGPAESVQFDSKVTIVHPERFTRCRPDEVGEIWVSGPSVAQGYWNRPEDTEHTFRARLAGAAEGPFLRTGDLGFVKDGVLFITGRLKDLVIIHGRNHYPQDIEMTVERAHRCIRPGCCAAFSIELDNEEVLVVLAEADPRIVAEQGETVKSIRRAILEHHDVVAHAVLLLKPATIPKTSSGKIQRSACRAAYLEGALDVLQN